MTTTTERQLKNGKRRITVDIDKGDVVVVVRSGSYYKLGYPLDETVPAHVLAETVLVTWCCIEQKWTN